MLTRRAFMALLGWSSLGAALPRERMAIQPLSPYRVWAVDTMRVTLEEVFGYEVTVRDALPIPHSAIESRRGRYHAPSVAVTLGGDLVLGITDVDLCQSYDHPVHGHVPDWGVIGVAQLGGPYGVISTHRVRDQSWLPVIVAHETGHLRGYADCETPGCQMLDVRGDGSKYHTMRYGWFCEKH